MNSLCRALARISSSQTTRRAPSLIHLFHQSDSYSSAIGKHKPPTPKSTETLPFPKKSPSSTDFPRPKEIPFQAKVANSINLIGYVDMPIRTQVSSPDGKSWSATIITQEPSYHSPALRIPIVFQDDLAHIAASHLKKGDYVYVAGQLSTDPLPIPEMQDQAQVQVLVNSINFIEGDFQMKKSPPQQLQEESLGDYASMKKDGDSVLNSWTDLLENPNQWWDYRSSKLSGLVKPKHPDFKHKNSGQAVWLTGAPKWIFSGLKKVKFDDKQGKEDEFWKDLVENPGQWWDNRFKKKNPKSPDFKHKETGQGLWLDTSPAWVLPKMPPSKSAENVSGT